MAKSRKDILNTNKSKHISNKMDFIVINDLQANMTTQVVFQQSTPGQNADFLLKLPLQPPCQQSFLPSNTFCGHKNNSFALFAGCRLYCFLFTCRAGFLGRYWNMAKIDGRTQLLYTKDKFVVCLFERPCFISLKFKQLCSSPRRRLQC